jgi:alkanesulfonate monooxygenase
VDGADHGDRRGGNSTALVGTPETVAAALLDYYDLGVRILSARGYDIYDDAIDFGRYVIPLVRDEVAKRDAEHVRTNHQPLPAPA